MISFSQIGKQDSETPILKYYSGDDQSAADHALTMREAYYRFKCKRSRDAPRTIEAYENFLNHWEALTRNPSLHDIDSDLLEDFKDAFLSQLNRRTGKRFSTNTWNKIESHMMAILNRCGPKNPYNKLGRGIIEDVPFVEPVKRRKRPVKIASHEQVSKIYDACAAATWPRTEVPSPLWWQSLVVWLFNIGSRRNDFLTLRWEQIDFERRVFTSQEEKTSKSLPKPLNQIVLSHLLRIKGDRALVFPKSAGNRMLYKHWYQIQVRAGIPHEKRILFHEMRKTCCTAFYKESPGAAQEMMGHEDLKTTRESYWAPSDHLVELSDSLEQPSAFK